MQKILVLFAHPLQHKSKLNVQMIRSIEGVEGITVNDLYNTYPDFFIDVKKEQELLMAHDIIIWHHPFYWFSAPAIIKEWFDLVLEYGFAFGSEGNALVGKSSMSVVTTGALKDVYNAENANRFELKDYLLPYQQSSLLCKMNYLPPFAVHGSHLLSNQQIERAAAVYKQVLIALRDEKFSLEEIQQFNYTNEMITTV